MSHDIINIYIYTFQVVFETTNEYPLNIMFSNTMSTNEWMHYPHSFKPREKRIGCRSFTLIDTSSCILAMMPLSPFPMPNTRAHCWSPIWHFTTHKYSIWNFYFLHLPFCSLHLQNYPNKQNYPYSQPPNTTVPHLHPTLPLQHHHQQL